jgi:hypothetical protein
LADMSDRPRAQFDGDYRAVGEALRSYLADAVTTTLDGLSDQPQRKANARRRMREWGEILRAHGIAARDVDGPDDASSGTDEGSFRQGQGGSP